LQPATKFAIRGAARQAGYEKKLCGRNGFSGSCKPREQEYTS
jgi:hypothetical protein